MNVRLRLALLFLPVLLQLCLFRLTEYSLMHTDAWAADSETTLAGIFRANAPGFFLALLVPIALYAIVRFWAPRVHPALAALPGLLAILVTFFIVPSRTLISPWLSSGALAFVLLDNVILVVGGAAFLIVMERTRGIAFKLAVTSAHFLAGFTSLLLTMNFGYFLKTGTSGDWLLFWYALQTIHETRDVIASEIDWLEISLLALPLFVALGPLAWARLRVVRDWKPAREPVARTFFWVIVGCTLLAVGSHSVARNGVSRTGASLFAGFVREAASVREIPPRGVDAVTPAFDAANLRLLETPDFRRMNVVFVILESVRADALTPYDSSLDTTPFLDSLAATGLLVEHMYAPVAHTTKALVPLLAGVYPTLHLQFPEARPGGLPARALPDLFAPLGYRSAFFSPAPLDFENKDGLLRNMGFEKLRGDGSFDTEGFERIGYFGYEDRIVVKPSMEWVDEAVRDGAPFFLSILTLTTHHPYNPPSDFAGTTYDHPLPDGYLNAVASTDAFVRELYHEFARRDLLEETLFIFASDHGEAFREHGMTGHNQVLWDEVLHVPAILHNAKLFDPGDRVTGPRSQVDFLPTIADLLGLDLRDGMIPGRSLLEESTDERVIYHSAWNSRQGLAMRDANAKYLYFARREPMRAFRTREDPRERNDVAPELPDDLLQEVERELIEWRWAVAAAYDRAALTAEVSPGANHLR